MMMNVRKGSVVRYSLRAANAVLESTRNDLIMPLFFFSCVGLVAAVSSAQSVVGVEFVKDLQLGMQTALKIRVEAPKGSSVLVKDGKFGGLEVIGKKDSIAKAGAQTEEHVFEVKLLPLELGDGAIEPITLQVRAANGKTTELNTESIAYHVASPLDAAQDPKPRAFSAPVSLWERSWLPLWIALALILAVLAWFAYKKWSRLRKKKVALAPVVVVPPWELALQKLRALADALPNPEAPKSAFETWVDQVSDVLRDYLGRRFGFDGLGSTTYEVQRALKPHLSDTEHVKQLLLACDMVKFARADMQRSHAQEIVSEAIALVEQTRPAPPPAPVAQEGQAA